MSVSNPLIHHYERVKRDLANPNIKRKKAVNPVDMRNIWSDLTYPEIYTAIKGMSGTIPKSTNETNVTIAFLTGSSSFGMIPSSSTIITSIHAYLYFESSSTILEASSL